MSRQNRILALSQLLLRLGLVLALFATLTLPHPGMTAVAETSAMTMHHTADAQGQMKHPGGVHHDINGAFCAMLCAGMDRAEGPVHPVRFVDFVVARWSIDALPAWSPVQPDPAERPPDTTPDA